ncbi:MAG: carbohydrate ABC transporter permease [Fibrobacterota bacterium]
MSEKIRKYGFEILMVFPAFSYLLGFFIIIIAYLLKLSFTSLSENYQTLFPVLCNYREIFSNPDFFTALRNTSLFMLAGTPVELFAGLFLAILINRSFRGRGLVRSAFIIPLAVPAIVTAIIIYILSDYPAGHINSFLTGKYFGMPEILDAPVKWRGSTATSLGISLLGKVWRDTPICMLILLAGLSSIDEDQYKAAETMGAGHIRMFFLITLPNLMPSIFTVLVMRSIEMWKEFIFPYVLAPSDYMLGTLIENLYHDWRNPYQASVVAVIMVVCIILTILILNFSVKLVRKNLVRL